MVYASDKHFLVEVIIGNIGITTVDIFYIFLYLIKIYALGNFCNDVSYTIISFTSDRIRIRFVLRSFLGHTVLS